MKDTLLILTPLAMIFLHIVDDYYLQGILAQMKQKKWWEGKGKMYEGDYVIALFMHAFSWSFMTHIPIILFCIAGYCSPQFVVCSCMANMIVHGIIDDLKANRLVINLATDQFLHILQLFITYIVFRVLMI